ncbi:MAG: CxxC-x17-CxxC domain-containing protein [Candidatus Magasanikiibacteriota bacterium]
MGSYNRDDKRSSGGFSRGGNRSFGGPSRFGGGRDGGRPMMHKAVCSECGDDCEIPFRPSGDRPVFCSICFDKQGGGSGTRPSKFGGDRRERPSFGSDRGDRQMFDAVCDKCGEDCQVPFRPTEGKPVYCSNCFDKNDRGAGSNRGGAQSSEQFDAINAKLDMIMTALGLTASKKESIKAVEKAPSIKTQDKSEKPKAKKEVVTKKVVKEKKETKKPATKKKVVAKKK